MQGALSRFLPTSWAQFPKYINLSNTSGKGLFFAGSAAMQSAASTAMLKYHRSRVAYQPISPHTSPRTERSSPYYFPLSVWSIGINYILIPCTMLYALYYSPALTVLSIRNGLQIPLSMLLAAVFLDEAPSGSQLAGTAFSTLGVVGLVLYGPGAISRVQPEDSTVSISMADALNRLPFKFRTNPIELRSSQIAFFLVTSTSFLAAIFSSVLISRRIDQLLIQHCRVGVVPQYELLLTCERGDPKGCQCNACKMSKRLETLREWYHNHSYAPRLVSVGTLILAGVIDGLKQLNANAACTLIQRLSLPPYRAITLSSKLKVLIFHPLLYRIFFKTAILYWLTWVAHRTVLSHMNQSFVITLRKTTLLLTTTIGIIYLWQEFPSNILMFSLSLGLCVSGVSLISMNNG